MSVSTDAQSHWEQVYLTKADPETSWFQDEPLPSLELIRDCALPDARIIDVGGGSSLLCARLAERGYRVTVLDISQAAIDRAKARAGALAGRIRWLVADITRAADLGHFDLWHDRAAFHFLTDDAGRQRYIAQAMRTIVPGGHAIIGTFAIDGPEKCSGLTVERYDEARLASAFGDAFTIIRTRRNVHTTPWGKPQAFFYAVLRRLGKET